MRLIKFNIDKASEVSSLIRKSIFYRDNRGYTLDQIFSICNHHSVDNLMKDLDKKMGYMCIGENSSIIGVAMLKGDEVTKVFIDPAHQGKGIGRALMNLLEKEATRKELKKVWLISSLPAIDFYKKLGYVILKDYAHPDWGKAVIMEKRLS